MNEQDRHRQIKLIVQKPDGNPCRTNRFTYQQAIEKAVWAKMDALILDAYGAWLGQRGRSLFLLLDNGHFSFAIN